MIGVLSINKINIMTFLWADIPFEFTPLSFRYHNDMIW